MLCLGLGALAVPACSGVNVGERARETPIVASDCESELQLDTVICEKLAKLELASALPPSAGNRYADNEDAAQLGFLIFYDQNFSTISEVRCATCHEPEFSFGDGKARSEVIPGRSTPRNSPSILNAAWAGPYYFWDGRADSMWSQPLFAFENPDEMASSRLRVAHTINAQPIYKRRYEALFGPLPDLNDKQRFPADGKPGDPNFDNLAAADQEAINRVAANVGKLLEAYMRKVSTGPSALDEYLSGQTDALDATAKAGLSVFAKRGCIDCHSGPALSDGAFHNVGTSDGDSGRAGAIELLRASPFNSAGPYYDHDGPVPQLPVAQPSDVGAYRTPTLRNLSRTAPYMHDGRYATLEELLAGPHGFGVSGDELHDLDVFLLSLNGAYPQRPWSDWPAR